MNNRKWPSSLAVNYCAVPPASAPAERSFRILVIEDNLDAADSTKVLLELLGHQVAVAHDGMSGIETARAFHPEIILSDIGLPGKVDEYGVARALRPDPAFANAVLIALSGYGQDDDQRRSRDAGFDLHLTKPIDFTELPKLLASLTNRPGG